MKHRLTCRCVVCEKVRFVTPLWATTKVLRSQLTSDYVCSDCTARATPAQLAAYHAAGPP